jgi:hypothetical protein
MKTGGGGSPHPIQRALLHSCNTDNKPKKQRQRERERERERDFVGRAKAVILVTSIGNVGRHAAGW